MHDDIVENRAIELYIEEDLPHDLPWSRISESTRDGYRQRATHEIERRRHVLDS